MVQQIDAQLFSHMIRIGAEKLHRNVDEVNALNVFPVPDGDTGTNMNLTLTSGLQEMENKAASSSSVGDLAEALSKGLLMGARGNSGVILSQLFRGFGKAAAEKETLTARQFAEALQRGVDTAYKAVIKPVEGTVLTVSREAAEAGWNQSRQTDDAIVVMEAVLERARESLHKTPQLLPVLAQANVVDAGGRGLVLIYEGFLAALTGEEVSYVTEESSRYTAEQWETLGEIAHRQSAQAHFDPSSIEFGYCTEFILRLKPAQSDMNPFDEEEFRREIGEFGDSLLVVADDDLVKVHIHAEYPGKTMTYAQQFGDLTRIKIENMREQHSTILKQDSASAVDSEALRTPEVHRKPYGIVAVAAGEGIADIFSSLGADVVIQGGQTMNPSTEDILRSIEKLHADHVIVLPNNKNIIMTAEQVKDLLEMPVTVLPTRTIPQGLSALLSFNEEEPPQVNQERMLESIAGVHSGEVTYAVRDSVYDGGPIKKGDFLGIEEGKILTVGEDLLATSRDLLGKMLAEEADVVTIIYGQDVTDAQVKELKDYLEQNYPDVECEVHDGGQPLYFFLFAVE